MQVNTSTVSLPQAINLVGEIDFSPINKKLASEDKQLWTEENLSQAENLYRKFLTLRLINPSAELVPNETIDAYWHQHILDTRKYQKDCNQLFGGLMHHDPHFGLKDEAEKQENLSAFDNTQILWKKAFGESLLGQANPCAATDCR